MNGQKTKLSRGRSNAVGNTDVTRFYLEATQWLWFMVARRKGILFAELRSDMSIERRSKRCVLYDQYRCRMPSLY